MMSKFDLELNQAIHIFMKTVDLDALNYNAHDISKKIGFNIKIITFIINCQSSRKYNEIDEDIFHATSLAFCDDSERDTINKQKKLIVDTIKELYKDSEYINIDSDEN